jgi:hypothetical protein
MGLRPTKRHEDLFAEVGRTPGPLPALGRPSAADQGPPHLGDPS